MKIIFLCFALFLMPFTEENAVHDFHVSKCEVDYNQAEQALQVTLHLFLDDLQLSMQKQGAEEVFLCTDQETENAEIALFQYLKHNLQFDVNENENIAYNWLGKEMSEDKLAVWCYIEISNIYKLTFLKVKNTLIMDVYDDQQNIVQVKGASKSGFFMLHKDKESQSITF